ncbi:MAG: glycosyltransferase family 9 protein [Bacteroidia bacterium]|nr:glycosyltransferase family 9 protein [Bacteroidia bacterium]
MRFLFVRLSSMGDVVLTTPLIRALAEHIPNAEIHFLTRASYLPLVAHHPLLAGVHSWPPSEEVRQQTWEGVIDLHKNLRTLSLRWKLRYRKFTTFSKENWQKWWMVRKRLPISLSHVVTRYSAALEPWGISPEKVGPAEVHVPPFIQERVRRELHEAAQEGEGWLAVGLGGTYDTKKWPIAYYKELLTQLGWPIILLGGAMERAAAETLAQTLPGPVIVGAGRYSLLETAAAIREAAILLSHDTGTAHLGAAVGTPTVVLWGNTVPELGMTPWQVQHLNIEARHLSCRPCSKLGFASCPRGHHDCMRALTPDYVEMQLRAFRGKS